MSVSSSKIHPHPPHPLLNDIAEQDSALEAMLEEDVEDNGTNLLTGEDYVLFRLHPSIDLLKGQRPMIHYEYVILRSIVLFAGLVSAILGVLGLHLYIPLSLALTSAAESFLSFYQVQARHTSISNALNQLEELVTWWNSLSMIERRLAKNKNLLVDQTEQAIEMSGAPYSRIATRSASRAIEASGNQEDERNT